MSQWRAYSGDRDGMTDPDDADWIHYNEHHETWADAFARLRKSAQYLAGDGGCETCTWDGKHLLARLDALTPGEEMSGSGDGSEYLLCRSERTDFADLEAKESAAYALVKDQRP